MEDVVEVPSPPRRRRDESAVSAAEDEEEAEGSEGDDVMALDGEGGAEEAAPSAPRSKKVSGGGVASFVFPPRLYSFSFAALWRVLSPRGVRRGPQHCAVRGPRGR